MSSLSRLSVCMIVRDSSRTLPTCLASIAPWADELIVVDTGSLDDTRDIAVTHGARVFDFPWCDDFSAARNESLRHATGEWIFWLDSDDTISPENGRELRKLAEGALGSAPTAYVMQVHCPGPPGTADVTVVDHVKMFRNDPRLRFEGRIHEQILPAIRRIDGTVEWTNIYVTHSGSEHTPEAKHRKQARDLRLLEMELAEKPEHPFVLFNLGMTYADMEEHHKAVEFLKCCLTASSPDESHVRKAYALLVGCLTQVDQDDEAMRILCRGRELFPDDPELWFRLGILAQRAKDHSKAIEAYRAAIEKRDAKFFSSRDHGVTGYKARHNLSVVYRETGRMDLSELQWRLTLQEQPTYREGWRGLTQLLLEQKKYATLEVEIESARTDGMAEGELACAAAQLAVARGNLSQAIEILDAINAVDEAEPLRLKCQLLFESSAFDEAIASLEKLCQIHPYDGAAWHNLGTAYQKTDCPALAVTCYQKSLTKRPRSVPTLVQLGWAQHALARHEAAERTWKVAMSISPDDPMACEAVNCVKKLSVEC